MNENLSVRRKLYDNIYHPQIYKKIKKKDHLKILLDINKMRKKNE